MPEAVGTPPRPSSGGRFELIDSMRAFAALSVILYHVSFQFAYSKGIWANLTLRNTGQPVTCVVLFFVVSGFVLYRPFVAARYAGKPLPRLRSYSIRRVARIVPAYWVALAISMIWVPLPEVKDSFLGLLKYFGFAQVYGTEPDAVKGLGVAWSLCVEVTFYVAVPIVAITVRKLGARFSPLRSELTMLAAIGLFALVYQLVILVPGTVTNPEQQLQLVLMTLPGGFNLFAAGMLLAVISVDLTHRKTPPRWLGVVDRFPWITWLMAVPLFYLIPRVVNWAGWGGYAGYIPAQWMKALFCFLLMVPAIFGRHDRGLLRKFLGLKPLLYVGTISYGVYLWHTPLLTKIQGHLVPHGRVITLAVLLAITLVLGSLSYYLIEQPTQRLARRALHAPSAVPPASPAEQQSLAL